MPQKGFHIINASAGSGKTYTLVFQYLQQLLATPQKDSYQYMLAMTFTNKAVNEMKERILEVLSLLATGNSHSMTQDLKSSLELSDTELQWRAQTKLHSLLHNFGAFEVTTLDSFTHGVIRTFAFDLGLSHSFEVIIDSKSFIREIVDQLIEKVGVSKELTRLLTQFSLQKINDEKSWDVSIDLNEFAPILLNENDRIPLQVLQQGSLQTFEEDLRRIRERKQRLAEQIMAVATRISDRLRAAGLTEKEFPRGLLINHFKRLSALGQHDTKTIKRFFKNQLGKQLEQGEGFYKKNTSSDLVGQIQQLIPALHEAYQQTQADTFEYLFLRALEGQWVPLSLLGALGQALESEQQLQNRRLLSRFNERIAAIVQEQPVPFIYERLGSRYRHYFIDEFQDTSVLQWHNLVPLVANAIESDPNNSLVLVGDPKQSIYRWRGGDVQQFFDLLNKKTNFSVPPEIHRLEKNYRSYDQLIAFNNQFFTDAAKALKDPQHQKLFSESVIQKSNDKKGGTVAIHRIEAVKTAAERGVLYGEKVVGLVKELRKQGYAWKDMVVLIRNKKQARILVEHLQEQSLPVLSTDSLLLVNSKQVGVLIQLLQLICFPKDRNAMKEILGWIWEQKESSTDYHDFISSHLKQSSGLFFKRLNKEFNLKLNWEHLRSLSVYEAIEYSIEHFDFLLRSDVYLQRFLDVVFSQSQQFSSHPRDFLTFWERESEKLTIQLPENSEAIQVMTVHKSKGLEFEVVIYPFLEDSLQPSIRDQIWYPLAEFDDLETSWARFPFSESLDQYGPMGAVVKEAAQRASALDALNVLYVGCTRAVAQLHLITRTVEKKPSHPSFDSLLQDFLEKQQGGETLPDIYYWSDVTPLPEEESTENLLLKVKMKNNLHWRNRLLFERRFDQAARDFGILIHDLLGKIKVPEQLEYVISEALRSGRLEASNRDKTEALVHEVMTHPKLALAFDSADTLWIERDILLPGGLLVRPDRVVIEGNQAVLIDFKTGSPQAKDRKQIAAYADVIERMGYEVRARYLVYMESQVNVESV